MRKLLLRLLAWPVLWALAHGNRQCVIVGMIAGSAVGLIVALMQPAFIVFGVLFGAYVGAVIAALIFRKSPSAPSAAGPMGSIWKYWEFSRPEMSRLTVLLERAIYIAYEDPRREAPWAAVIESLSVGMNPNFDRGNLIMLHELDDIEMRRADDVELDVRYRRNGDRQLAIAEFTTIEDRDQFIHGLEHALGHKFRRERRHLDLGRAVLAPLILLIPIACIIAGLAGYSAYLSNLPQQEQLRIVKIGGAKATFITEGPMFVMKTGCIPTSAVLAWLLFRVARPPQREVLLPSTLPPD